MEEKDGKVMPKILVFLLVILVIAFGIYGSYAYINYRADLNGDETNAINTCYLDMDVNGLDAISLINTYPMDDDKIENLTPYTVTIKKNSSNCSSIGYVLTIIDSLDSSLKIDPNLIRYEIKNLSTGEVYLDSNPYNVNISGVVDTDVVYEIKFWISNTAVNTDLYVYLDDGSISLDENGQYITKGFSAKVKLNVSMK